MSKEVNYKVFTLKLITMVVGCAVLYTKLGIVFLIALLMVLWSHSTVIRALWVNEDKSL